jgi:hypothetical protein
MFLIRAPTFGASVLGSIFVILILWFLGYVRFDEPRAILRRVRRVIGREDVAPSEDVKETKKS